MITKGLAIQNFHLI